MKYHFTKKISGKSFEDTVQKVTDELKSEGFGVLTEIDVKETLKKKIDVDFRKYKILGACHPHFAHKPIQTEPHSGVFLPCNVIVQETGTDEIEVSAVDPLASMSSVENENLNDIAGEVRSKLQAVIDKI
ncbi:MAG: DUF302 domain-containing protein [Ignavibacteria bacterium]|nr:DUF302 domain-containing protein [Ignavibacteria bacterium]